MKRMVDKKELDKEISEISKKSLSYVDVNTELETHLCIFQAEIKFSDDEELQQLFNRKTFTFPPQIISIDNIKIEEDNKFGLNTPSEILAAFESILKDPDEDTIDFNAYSANDNEAGLYKFNYSLGAEEFGFYSWHDLQDVDYQTDISVDAWIGEINIYIYDLTTGKTFGVEY